MRRASKGCTCDVSWRMRPDVSHCRRRRRNVASAKSSPHSSECVTPALVSDVQGWLNNPATNFGWAVVNYNEGTGGTVKAFYSRTATQNSTGGPLSPSFRPALTITFVIPEPNAAALICLTSPLVLITRRR